jgi:hypothetical protein
MELLTILQFPPDSCHCLTLRNILLSPLFSSSLCLCSYLDVKNQVSHLYNITGKMITLYIQIFTFLDSEQKDKELL